VTEMPVRPAVSTQQSALSQGKGKTLPLINGDNSDQNHLPRIDADDQGSKPTISQKRLPKVSPLPESKLESETKIKTLTTEAAEEHGGKGKPQPRAAVPHEHRVG
jgi:hypothetical protein